MYTSSYVTVTPVAYPVYRPGYVLYEVEEPSPLCSAGQLIVNGLSLIFSSMATICAVSTEALVGSCEKSKKRHK